MTKAGERVVAIEQVKEGTAYIFGFGEYVGDEVPPPGTPGPFGDAHAFGIPNPRIDLDDGVGTVWGCQCWWKACHDEDELREITGCLEVVVVPLPGEGEEE